MHFCPKFFILTLVRRNSDQQGCSPRVRPQPLHFGWADLCDRPKCGRVGIVISKCGVCVRAHPDNQSKNRLNLFLL